MNIAATIWIGYNFIIQKNPIVSSLEYLPHSQLPKKNSCHGNYMRKYSRLFMIILPAVFTQSCLISYDHFWTNQTSFKNVPGKNQTYKLNYVHCWIGFSYEITHFSLLQTCLRHERISFEYGRHGITLVNTAVHKDFQPSGFLFRGRGIL